MPFEKETLVISREMEALVREVEAKAEKLCGKKIGVALFFFTAEGEAGGRMQYGANVPRPDVADALLGLLAHWIQENPDIIPHKVN